MADAGIAAYGSLLSAPAARPILEAAGVTPEMDIGIEGFEFPYGGNTFWIMQRGIKFPNPDNTSPDGWHIVYSPSQEELDLGKLPENPIDAITGTLSTLAKTALIIAVIYGASKIFGK